MVSTAALPVFAGCLICWQSLNDAVPGEHAAIDGEVPADHKGPHGRILLGKGVRFVREIGLILATVHKHQAGIAIGIAVALVHGIPPPTPAAKAFQILHIKAPHGVTDEGSGRTGSGTRRQGTAVGR